jgi:hypothetical protein
MIEIDHKAFVTAVNEVAATDSGKILLACLKDSCQWDETYLSSEDPQVTQFYAVKRGVYGGLRKLIKIGYLKEIEFNYKRKVEDGREPTKPRISAKPSDRTKRTK